MITASVDSNSSVGEILSAITIPSEVASGPINVDSSTVNGISSVASSSDGGTIRIVIPILIVGTIDVINTTIPVNIGAVDSVGNIGSGISNLGNHTADIACLIVITAPVDIVSKTGDILSAITMPS